MTSKTTKPETNTTDFAQTFQNFFETMTNPAQEVMAFSAKMNEIALAAAQKNAELSAKCTQDILAELTSMNKPQGEVADYTKAITDAVTANVQGAPERVSQFAEVAKNAQVEAVEAIMATTKDLQAKTTKAA